ncbi:MAG: hypothetical protein EDM82_15300 [Cyanobacteria bacterium CYA]|nr:MAG: hypothetical protein EDM82_15300 [Cyanobacteria bacterium CYA]
MAVHRLHADADGEYIVKSDDLAVRDPSSQPISRAIKGLAVREQAVGPGEALQQIAGLVLPDHLKLNLFQIAHVPARRHV